MRFRPRRAPLRLTETSRRSVSRDSHFDVSSTQLHDRSRIRCGYPATPWRDGWARHRSPQPRLRMTDCRVSRLSYTTQTSGGLLPREAAKSGALN